MITDAGIKAAIRSVGPGKKKSVELRDDGNRGEGRLVILVRALAQERVTVEWYAVWWRDERRSAVKLGTYPTLSVADARKAFTSDYAPEISAGRDPTGPKARKARIGVTVKDLFETYVDHLQKAGKPSAKAARIALLGPEVDEKGLCANGRKPVTPGGAAAALGASKRAVDVTVDDIREFLGGIHERGAICAAAELRARIHAAYNWGIKSANSYKAGAARATFGLTVNPCTAIPTDPDAQRVGDRHLTPAEFRVFWRWLISVREERGGAESLRLQMAIGQRVTECLRLSEPAYDRREDMLDWSRTKNGMPHAIPLPPQAITILDGLAPNRFGLYFPHARKPDEPATITSIDNVVTAFLADADFKPKLEYEKEHGAFKHFTPRDLRRTWKTLAGAAGISKDMRDRLQNHARTDVSSRHYDRYDYLPEKRAAMTKWGNYLDRILTGELDNPVARLHATGG